MRQADSILARFPGPVTLHPHRLKLLGAFVMCVGLLVFSVFLLFRAIEAESSEVVWASAGILVCGVCAARLALLPLMPRTIGLTLDVDGFEIRGILRRMRYAWRDVDSFRVAESADYLRLRLVRFDLRAAGMPRRDAQRTGALPGNYPLPDDDLASLMTQWRERALALPRPASVPHVGSAGRRTVR